METPAAMNPEPRFQSEYGSRQTDAAHRVLIDLAQVLAPFQDCLVLIGGWVPYLLLPDAQEPHVGSIDVDLALKITKRMKTSQLLMSRMPKYYVRSA